MPYWIRALTMGFFVVGFAVMPGHAAAVIELTVSPHVAYRWNYASGHAEFVYTVRLDFVRDNEPGWLCTGWTYPVEQWHDDQYPTRASCRWEDRQLLQESWGGRRMPLPYVGEYIAFARLYASEEARSPSITVTQLFTVLEGIPSP